jgi:hypothetical protein
MIEQIVDAKYRLKANIDIDFFNREFELQSKRRGLKPSRIPELSLRQNSFERRQLKLDACTIIDEKQATG